MDNLIKMVIHLSLQAACHLWAQPQAACLHCFGDLRVALVRGNLVWGATSFCGAPDMTKPRHGELPRLCDETL
jgi:hypothetical protein